MGTVSTGSFFDQLASEATGLTWALRLVGFIVMWIAFCLCFGPLEVAGDCIPCIGPCVGDSIAAITCCATCLPATACTLGVAGFVWALMRPWVGIPMLVVFCAIMVGFGGYVRKRRQEKGGPVLKAAPPNPNYGTTQVQAAPVAMAQAAIPQARQMQVQAPMGLAPGQLMQFQTPDGNMMQVAVPQGTPPGGVFTISY